MPPTTPLGVTAVMLPEIDFAEQLELCVRAGITHYSWRPRIIPDEQRDQPYNPWGRHEFDLTPRRLLDDATDLRRRLEDAGLVSFGTLPKADTAGHDDELKLHFEGAAAVGAGRVRVAPAPYPEGPFDYETVLGQRVERFERIVELARPFGQKIVLETHSRSLVTSPALALNICRHFDPADLGVIFDINNFMIEGGLVPNLAVAVIGAYIDHSHVGGARRLHGGQRDELGFRVDGFEMCSLTEADQNITAWLKALHDAGIRAPLIIENFTAHLSGSQRLLESATQVKSVLGSFEGQ